MMLEGQDPGAEETPAPPARTRWSEDAAEDDDVLLPPYFPGAPRGPAAGGAEPAGAPGGESDPEPGPAPDAETEADPWVGEEVAQPDPEPSAATIEPEPAAGAAESGADFPWEPEAEGAGSEWEDEAESADESQGGPDPMEMEPYEPDYAMPESPAEEDVPYGAYDLGEVGDEGLVDAAADIEEEGPPEPPEAFGLPGLEEIPTEPDSIGGAPVGPAPSGAADRVDKLAAILRREGLAGIQREVASRDRLTSLLAGVIAGYLAGLEE